MCSVCIAQTDTVRISHLKYITTFDTVLRYPVKVTWHLDSLDFRCNQHIARSKNFETDPLLSAYTDLKSSYEHSGYDQGHNMDANDNECSIQGMHESFYYSNMCPQLPELNRGVWKDLEDYTRQLAKKFKVMVICGSFGNLGKIGEVTIPEYCWKILEYEGKEDCYLMPNKKGVNQKHYSVYRVDKTKIQSELLFTLE